MRTITTNLITLDENEFNTLVNYYFPKYKDTYNLFEDQDMNVSQICVTIDMEYFSKYGKFKYKNDNKYKFERDFIKICHKLVKKEVFPEDATIIVVKCWL